ncbi:MAG: methionine adenosyltransferase, partial [Candidatus Peribacteraceae bacterium]|nr:methionine adenosyltransferase [Candidatus Peribacteraceae bacterium]
MPYLFTSESVTEGHPDKICDQISDAILDAAIRQDPQAHVACECMATTGLVIAAGEMRTKGYVDIAGVARETIREIGYDDAAYGFDHKACAVIVSIGEQSADIAQGVDEDKNCNHEQGAGDQGLMFGYACDETPELMPLPIALAHRLTRKLANVRKNKELTYLRPDGKSQVTVQYSDDGVPERVDCVVIATQHADGIPHEQICAEVKESIIKPVCGDFIDERTKYHINPTGRFVIGGPPG